MILHSTKDFVIPTLSVLESLGGEAKLNEIEAAFLKRYASNLDPKIDWYKVTLNHNKALWADRCGSRVVFNYLKPEGYIVIENQVGRGSVWKLTDKGRAKLKENLRKPVVF